MTKLPSACLALSVLFCGHALAQGAATEEDDEDEDSAMPEQVLQQAPSGAGAAAVQAGAAGLSGATGSRMSAPDAQAVLAHHNQVRAEVGVPPLAWSAEVAAHAQDWTDQLARNSCGFAHRPNNRFGENLFMGTAGAYKALDGSVNWAREKKDWPGGVFAGNNAMKAGHYTQMVWRTTVAVGCGESVCNGRLIMACNYSPAGNMIGTAPY